ncbi:phosphotransferase [Flavobacteriaceae bacterium F89]|uniref:Phosphotransferase n=1 Tax=Cerina litoralis TaxID=2874477 RepID=A0AAE3EX20_9FLAO|nr:phosphotransferase [Cerina litoralis]MCG2462687.1 phosphotransferase [Cerina litoralis]
MIILKSEKSALQAYLKTKGWLKPNEIVTAIEVPGKGNMNFTLRIKTRNRSFIIKQSRGYVEKYPQVPAPEERVLREAEFYNLTGLHDHLRKQMPEVYGIDIENHVLQLEDLGTGTDYSFLYEKNNFLAETELRPIIEFTAYLHRSINTKTTATRLANRPMRQLNHEHIFVYPYLEENGLNLDTVLMGLHEVGQRFKNDLALKKVIAELGKRYLSDGASLLHGDYFPGSWLRTDHGFKVIDPEFGFFGDPEFEIGVTLAHLKMAAQTNDLIQKAISIYKEIAPLDVILCEQFIAVEILRRILGLAQLPLALNLEERMKLLEEAHSILV